MGKSAFDFDNLDEHNYATWSAKMTFLLVVEGIWQCVEENTGTAANKSKAKALIGLKVNDMFLPIVGGAEDAQAAWNALKTMHLAKTEARHTLLLDDLQNLKLKPNESLVSYFSRARRIRDDLAAIGKEVAAPQLLRPVLRGLPVEYSTLQDILMEKISDLTLEDCYAKLLNVEERLNRQREQASLHDEEAAAAMLASRLRRFCSYCKKHGHAEATCWEKKKRQRVAASTAAALALSEL